MTLVVTEAIVLHVFARYTAGPDACCCVGARDQRAALWPQGLVSYRQLRLLQVMTFEVLLLAALTSRTVNVTV